MGRSLVTVQRVEAGLEAQFIELWIAHRIEIGTTPEAACRLAADGTLRRALARHDVTAYIAFVDGVPAGYVVIADTTRSLLVAAPSVSIDMLYVHADYRRQGVGKGLLAAASRYADRNGCEHLVSAVPAQDREANRFFARLGFAPETVRRVTSSATLQRKLAGEPRAQRYSLDKVLQRRRDVRARTATAQSPGAAG
ncbi:GNAT family N-acetyltransferase [Intrasporangium sp. DVR]|uniref:GNAT family N-acetyltransferase n=1 Tax=Intrasporangium sp. DVR TaxID=3127867 RepID=UPI00313A55D7